MRRPEQIQEIVIAGGGLAGLEAVLALRALAGHRVRITLVTDAPLLPDRPSAVQEPFGRGQARSYDVRALADDQRVELVLDRLATVHADRHTVDLAGGDELTYDILVIATGADSVAALPDATQFRGARDVPAMRAVVDDLRTGTAASVAFVLPDPSTWPVPLYELALMTGAELRAEARHGVRVTIVTPEPDPLAIFGAAAAAPLRSLLEDRGVTVVTRARAVRVEPGSVRLADGRTVAADRVVALAASVARPPRGVPRDADGFVPVDAHGRVKGIADVYAAGDVTDHVPVKQGGLATQQADAVAEAIAARLGAIDEPRPFRPVIRGVLLVNGVPLYLRADLSGNGDGATVEHLPRTAASPAALWWPPAKVAGRYLAPYFATARPRLLAPAVLVDRPTRPVPAPAGDRSAPAELALALADADARVGDFDAAVRALDAATALQGVLAPEYERKRRQWLTNMTSARTGATVDPPREA